MKLCQKAAGCIAAAALCLSSVSAGAVNSSFYWEDLYRRANRKDTVISIASDRPYPLSCTLLEQQLGLSPNSLRGLTLTRLDRTKGVLLLDGMSVGNYWELSRDQIDRLVFVPGKGVGEVSLSFVPKTDSPQIVNVSLRVTNPDSAPETKNSTCETLANVSLHAGFAVSSGKSESLSIEIISPPAKGSVTVDGLTFRYDPYPDEQGTDSFTYRARGGDGGTSQVSTVSIQITAPKEPFYYADLPGERCEYSAIQLYHAGVLRGESVGARSFFYPSRSVTRGELLTGLLAACGLDQNLTACVNTGLRNDGEIPLYLKPYVKAAMDKGILTENSFAADEIPTRAETVVLIDRAAGIHDVQSAELLFPDRDTIPDWALPSYRDLCAYRMFDFPSQEAQPQRALDRSYTAELLWQLYKLQSKSDN